MKAGQTPLYQGVPFVSAATRPEVFLAGRPGAEPAADARGAELLNIQCWRIRGCWSLFFQRVIVFYTIQLAKLFSAQRLRALSGYQIMSGLLTNRAECEG
jgi:hypothetical protein